MLFILTCNGIDNVDLKNECIQSFLITDYSIPFLLLYKNYCYNAAHGNNPRLCAINERSLSFINDLNYINIFIGKMFQFNKKAIVQINNQLANPSSQIALMSRHFHNLLLQIICYEMAFCIYVGFLEDRNFYLYCFGILIHPVLMFTQYIFISLPFVCPMIRDSTRMNFSREVIRQK